MYLRVIADTLQFCLHEIGRPHVSRVVQSEWAPSFIVARIRIGEEFQPLEDIEAINQTGAVQSAILHRVCRVILPPHRMLDIGVR